MTKRKDTEKKRLCQKIGDSYASVDDGEGIIFVNTRIKDESMKARRFAHFLDWDTMQINFRDRFITFREVPGGILFLPYFI